MVADFFTKPLQGNLFRKFRIVIMLPIKERVGFTIQSGNGTSDSMSNHTSDGAATIVVTKKVL